MLSLPSTKSSKSSRVRSQSWNIWTRSCRRWIWDHFSEFLDLVLQRLAGKTPLEVLFCVLSKEGCEVELKRKKNYRLPRRCTEVNIYRKIKQLKHRCYLESAKMWNDRFYLWSNVTVSDVINRVIREYLSRSFLSDHLKVHSSILFNH